MKRFNILFVFMILLSIIVGACALMSPNPTATSPCLNLEPGESKICEIVANPQDVDFMLRLANAGALEADAYKAEEALKTVDMLIAIVEDGQISYSGLLSLIKNDVSPLIFVVVDEYSSQFAALNVYLTPKDIEFILYHLKRQRAIISMALLRGNTTIDTEKRHPFIAREVG